MLGNSIHRSIWKHWEVEERVLGRAWVPACCFIKCQTGLGTDWISGPKISMGCSGRCQKKQGRLGPHSGRGTSLLPGIFVHWAST